MSQTHPFSHFQDDMAPSQRRVPAPITNLPVNALTDDLDPTREIRTLIEQLQVAAREARGQLRAAEEQKDALGLELEEAREQIAQHRHNEVEFRAKFVEITSLLQERDQAVKEVERLKKRVADQLQELSSAAQERDELSKREAAATHSTQIALGQLNDAQKLILNIRQARDVAQELNLSLSRKAAQYEDLAADAVYQRDSIQNSQKNLTEEISNLRRQLGVVTNDRDATMAQNAELADQLDEARQKLLDLAGQRAADLETDGQALAALNEARQQLEEVVAERDAARQRAQEQAGELDALNTQMNELRAEPPKPAVAPEELEELQRQLKAMEAERDLYRIREEQLAQETLLQQEHLGELSGHVAALQEQQAQSTTALEAARQQASLSAEDRDRQCEIQNEEAALAAAQILALQTRVTELESGAADGLSGNAEEAKDLARRLETQRLASIELGTRLAASQREILELSASLAEARLAAKFANERAARSQSAMAKDAALNPPAAASIPVSESTRLGEGAPHEVVEMLTEREAKSALAAMRSSFQAHQKNPADLSLLNELYSHVYGFSERARVSGLVAIHRLAAAFADLTHDLYRFPERCTPSALRTVHQAIELLTALMRDQAVAQLRDPAKATVYVVDADQARCKTIQDALGSRLMAASFAHDPASALGELADRSCELLLIDLNLPGLDGVELCAQIRQLPAHAKTAVLFLNASASLENNAAAGLAGGHDFLSEPFHDHEFSVKALALMLKAQLPAT